MTEKVPALSPNINREIIWKNFPSDILNMENSTTDKEESKTINKKVMLREAEKHWEDFIYEGCKYVYKCSDG